MSLQIVNNATSTLAANITDSDLTLEVISADSFPTLVSPQYFFCTLENSSGVEVVKVTGVSGNIFTVVRGQDGTTARPFTIGAKVEIRWNKQQVNDFSLKAIGDVTQEPTGFTSPENVVVTYDSMARTVTLTGTFEAFYRGKKISALTSGYVSSAHGTDTDKTYYLYHNGTSEAWSDVFPGFDVILICLVVYRAIDQFGVRECHSMQDWRSHRTDHYNIGTYRISGGDITGIVANSTTASERRPIVSACTVMDEDLPTILPILNNGAYALRYLNSGGSVVYSLDQSDLVILNAGVPRYNTYSAPNWSLTDMPANSVATVWLYAVPVTADASSQKRRFSFVQPQGITQAQNSSPTAIATAVSTEKTRTTLDLNLGQASIISAEYVAIAKFIVVYTGGTWFIREVISLTGSRVVQATIAGGSFLTSVSTDTTTISGTGTAVDPIKLTGLIKPAADSTTAVKITKADGTTPILTVDTTNNINTFSGNVIVTGDVTVNGTTTTLNTETLLVEDKNIEIGKVTTPTDVTADGGGITLKGSTDKTIIWDNANDNWTSSEHLNIASGKSFKINNVDINTAGTLTNVAYENQANYFTEAQSIVDEVPIINSYSTTQVGGSPNVIYRNRHYANDSGYNLVAEEYIESTEDGFVLWAEYMNGVTFFDMSVEENCVRSYKPFYALSTLYVGDESQFVKGIRYPITTLASTTTLTSSHYTVLCNGTFTVTLPSASANTGRLYNIKNIGTGTITIDGNGSETIDGALTKVISTQYDSYTIQSNGTGWFVV